MAEVEKLVIELSAKVSNLESGVATATKKLGILSSSADKTQRSLDGMGKAGEFVATKMRFLAASLSVGALYNMTRGAIDAGDALNDMAQRSGIAVETLSALQLYAKQNDASMQSLAMALKFMNKNMAEAQSGSKSAIEAFGQLGLTIDEMLQKSPEQQFMIIAQRISELGSEAQRTKALMDIFGRGGADLAIMMQKGAAGIEEAINKSKELGIVLGEEQAQKLARYNDKIDEMNARFTAFKISAVLGVADALQKLSDAIPEDKSIETLNKVLAQKSLDNNPDRTGAANAINEAAGLFSPIPKQQSKGRMAAPKQSGKRELVSFGGNAKESSGSIASVANDVNALQEALDDLQRQTSRDVYTHGMSELGQKLSEVEALVQDTALRYNTELTPAQQTQVEVIKENIRQYDELQQQQEESQRLADAMGSAFESSFERAITSGESLGDTLKSLAKDLVQLLIRQNITQPLGSAISGMFGGGGGLFSSLFSSLPSFDVGTPYVPRDMTANIHKGEMIIPADDAQRMRSQSSSGGAVYNIDARGADATAIRRLEQKLNALAGVGVVEARVNNAMKRGQV